MTEPNHAPLRIGLSLVVFLANAFLLVTMANATVALIDDTLIKSAIESPVFGFRTQLSALNLVLALLALASVILVPHLPKITMLPPLLVLMWQLVGAPGISWTLSDHASMATLDAILLGATAFGFVANKLTYGSWLITASSLPYHERLLRRTLIAAPLAAIALVVVSVVALLSAVPIFIEQQSRGYVHFASNGLEVRETIMRKGDRVVHLVGMVHIGEPAFYQNLFASIPPDALILAEGVTDREGKMKARPSYENAARGLGLESQVEFQRLLAGGKKVEPAHSVAAPAPTSNAPAIPTATASSPYVVFADVDVSDLSPSTLRFLEAAGTIFQSASLGEAMQRYIDLTGKFSEAEIKAVMDEIILKRNQKALSEFDRHEQQFKEIYLPWGALHMPDFEDKLKERGYSIASSRMIPIARYQTILNGILGQRVSSAPSPAPRQMGARLARAN